MEIDRRIPAGVHRRWRDRCFYDDGDRSSFHFRTTSTRFCRQSDEEPFKMATSVDRRPDDQDFADYRKDWHTAGASPRRYRQARAGNDRRSASRDFAIPHAGTTGAFETNGNAPAALDAAPRPMAQKRHSVRIRSATRITRNAFVN